MLPRAEFNRDSHILFVGIECVVSIDYIDVHSYLLQHSVRVGVNHFGSIAPPISGSGACLSRVLNFLDFREAFASFLNYWFLASLFYSLVNRVYLEGYICIGDVLCCRVKDVSSVRSTISRVFALCLFLLTDISLHFGDPYVMYQ